MFRFSLEKVVLEACASAVKLATQLKNWKFQWNDEMSVVVLAGDRLEFCFFSISGKSIHIATA